MVETLTENRLEAFIESLNKETWRTYKFSEIAFNIVEKVTPKESDLTHYIGLEHLDSGSIHIKRFGDPQSLDGDKLKIYKGDVIVGKRNAYLKRAAVAEFDAIASAHSFVLRANPDVILSELFPFFMLSERFWETAIRISVGSLSPTINWKTLAVQEFLLPPKEQQAKLAELLWAADEAENRLNELCYSLSNTLKARMNDRFIKLLGDVQVKTMKLGQIGKWISGGTPSTKNQEFWSNGTIMWVTPKDAKNDIISLTEDYLTETALEESSLTLHKSNSFCVVWRSGILQHSLPVIKVKGPFTTNQDMKAFVPKEGVVSEFVRVYLISNRETILKKCVKSGTTVQSIDSVQFYDYPIAVPSEEEQEEICDEYNALYKATSDSLAQVEHIRLIKKTFVNQIFD